MTNNAVKFIAGMFFTLLGILLTMDNLQLGDAWVYLRYWPIVLVAIGAVKVMQPGGRVIGTILLVIGLWFLANNVDWIRFSIFDFWPLILIIGGGLVVASALGFRPRTPLFTSSASNIFAVLSKQKVQVAEGERRVVTFMGECEIDLPEPQHDRAPVILETLTMWGGVELRVPDGWDVQGELLPVMGGFEALDASRGTPVQKVIVRGLALMGGVVVKRRMA